MQSEQTEPPRRQSMIGIGLSKSGIVQKFKQKAQEAYAPRSTSNDSQSKSTLDKVRAIMSNPTSLMNRSKSLASKKSEMASVGKAGIKKKTTIPL